MKLHYRQRLFLYFSIVFTAFTIGIVIFEQVREKSFRTNALEEKLDIYTDVINNKLVRNGETYANQMDDLHGVLPKDLRLTLIDHQGKVLFDNVVVIFLRWKII